MKKILKSRLFFFILGALIFGSIGTVFAYSIIASEVDFTPIDTTWNTDNVKGALDDLRGLTFAKMPFTVKENIAQIHTVRSAASVSQNLDKGNYLVLFTVTVGWGIQQSNYIYNGESGYRLTVSGGTCQLIDSRYHDSGGATAYTGNWYHLTTLNEVLYKCSFSNSGSVSYSKAAQSSTYNTDPYNFVIKSIKID